jgi:hypothetical protein
VPSLQTHKSIDCYGVLKKLCLALCKYMQALLPRIAQLSGLQLRELVLDIQSFPQPAAFLALFQWLPRTLRQLALRSTEYRVFGVGAERAPLPPGLLPASVQTTALRQVRRQDMLAGVGAVTDLYEHTAGVLKALSKSVLISCGTCTCVSTCDLTNLST